MDRAESWVDSCVDILSDIGLRLECDRPVKLSFHFSCSQLISYCPVSSSQSVTSMPNSVSAIFTDQYGVSTESESYTECKESVYV